MKTAVEWLIDELRNKHGMPIDLYSEFQQAKEREKEQIKKSFSDGAQWELYGSDLTYEERAKQYYNTTFKSE